MVMVVTRKAAVVMIFIMLFIFSLAHASKVKNPKWEVRGQVIDSDSGKLIKGAMVTVGNDVTLTDENGKFTAQGQAATIGFRAYGYTRTTMPVPASPGWAPLNVGLKPIRPKALYLTNYGIGDRSLRGNALKLINETELNSLVIDVKGDRGMITYKSEIPLAGVIGAQKLVIVKDIKGLLDSLKERGIYTIARIVVFKDNVLGAARPDLAVKTAGGQQWRDREGIVWMDASKKEVWDYNIDIAEEAARNGFDEIQFDYVRFPDEKGPRFSIENTEANRVNAISGFLKEARRRLTPYNVFLSADIFGYVAWNLNDTMIGQRLDSIAASVDYLAPMLYPSGFQFGIPGYTNPVEHPYEIIARTLENARQRSGLPAVRFRPWLQGFRDYAFDKRTFAGPEIRTQINAAESFGAGGWMLWNPRNAYLAEGLNKADPGKGIAGQPGKPTYTNLVEHRSEIVSPAVERVQQRPGLIDIRFSPRLQEAVFDKRNFSGPEIKNRINAAQPAGAEDWMPGNARYVYLALGLNKDPLREIILSRR